VNLDLGPLFSLAQTLAEQAMNTGGTRVSGHRGPDLVEVDPDTLEETTIAAAVTVADSVALLVPSTGGQAGAQPYPGTPRADNQWRMILPVAITDVLVGDIFTITACRDSRLALGRSFAVKAIPDSSAGAIRELSVSAHPATGQV